MNNTIRGLVGSGFAPHKCLIFTSYFTSQVRTEAEECNGCCLFVCLLTRFGKNSQEEELINLHDLLC